MQGRLVVPSRRGPGGAPSPSLPHLAGGDTLDDSTLSFLFQQAVLAQEKEKEEKEKKEKLLQEMFRRLTGEYIRELSQPSSSSQRRRKKRKKKKLPKSSFCTRRRHRQWHVPGWLVGYDAVLAVFPVVSLQAHDALHHGRYGPEGQWRAHRRFLAVLCARLVLLVLRLAVCSLWLSAGPRAGPNGPEAHLRSWLVLLVTLHLALCFRFPVVRPKMLDITAGMTRGVQDIGFCWEMTSYVSVFGSLLRQWIHIYVSLQRPGVWFRTAENFGNPHFQFIDSCGISCRGAEADSRGLAVQQTIVLLLLQYIDKVIDVFVQVQLVVRSCGRQSRSTVQLVVFVLGPGRRHPCRGANADSLGPVSIAFLQLQ